MLQSVGRVVLLAVLLNGLVAPAFGQLCGGGEVGTFYCNDAGTVPVALLVRAVNVALGTGDCPADPPARFEDTGLTVIDRETGLEWEKKTGTVGEESSCPGAASCGDPHNVNNMYSWSNSGALFDGGAQTLFLDVLNDVAAGGTSCFAGHCDWRLPSSGGDSLFPTGEPAELESIVDCSSGATCIDAAFGPDSSLSYWSSSTVPNFPLFAWFVSFDEGILSSFSKSNLNHVRAVRGGS